MALTHGFVLIDERTIDELRSRARLYRHQQTGAELLSLSNDDENKVFGITFRTPPSDSTGLPHILEHGVLNGSRKYPLKEPFVELIKGSLHTFINAFTYPDKTCYPVASTNLQDFYNLIDVYMDAVLHPRLSPLILQQEGWHYELDGPSDPLRYKGVVFNEMKGNYAVPDNLMHEYTQNLLMPDTTYAVDSGGNPRHIPDLTFEQYEGFHRRFYHPSNARIFFYGDDPEEARLALMEQFLSEFGAIDPNSQIEPQPLWAVPRRETRRFPVAADAAEDAKGMVSVAWLLPEVMDAETHLLFRLLDYILIETPASPLRRALIESGLGDDLSARGLADHLRQMSFGAGLKGINLADAPQVEALILDTLRTLVDEGIDKAMIEAALNATEFALRENNTGNFPRGLAVMLRALTPWLHDGEPLAALEFESQLQQIRDQLTSEPRLFEGLIQRYWLDNPHRLTVTMVPSSTLETEWQAAERQRLDAAKGAMSDAEIAQVIADMQRLREAQQRVDPPEITALLPRLTLDDLEREQKSIPTRESEVAGVPLLSHALGTNGILYLDLGLNLHSLPAELLPYGALFGHALLEMGSERLSYTALSQWIDRETGGIRSRLLTANRLTAERDAVWLFLQGKALVNQLPELLAILEEILSHTQFDNQERFRQIVLARKAKLEAALLPMGHQVILRRMRAHFSEAYWAEEQLTNIAQLQFVRRLATRIDNAWPAVREELERIRALLIQRGALLLNVTVDEEALSDVAETLADFVRTLPDGEVEKATWQSDLAVRHEGFAVPSQVNYVGQAADLATTGYEADGASLVVNRYLRMSHLWEQVRVQGGAYGGFSLLSPRNNLIAFASYRDPNLTRTLDVYRESTDFLHRAELDDAELTSAIIGAISDIDQYQLPDAKGWTGLTHWLAGVDNRYEQQIRDGIFNVSAADFRALGDALAKLNGDSVIAVMGGANALHQANEEQGLDMAIEALL
ncbi:MAG: insulinase family protein [Anaerolineales bacterium]|nr:insulinase family protein [Anaerolineales bacterium]MCB9126305.1 insulinase family protein [Ardenticatenales bacterium]MCB9171310.1 insulinase family protein [Ardenticatenales bacterium]